MQTDTCVTPEEALQSLHCLRACTNTLKVTEQNGFFSHPSFCSSSWDSVGLCLVLCFYVNLFTYLFLLEGGVTATGPYFPGAHGSAGCSLALSKHFSNNNSRPLHRLAWNGLAFSAIACTLCRVKHGEIKPKSRFLFMHICWKHRWNWFGEGIRKSLTCVTSLLVTLMAAVHPTLYCSCRIRLNTAYWKENMLSSNENNQFILQSGTEDKLPYHVNLIDNKNNLVSGAKDITHHYCYMDFFICF